MPYRYTMVTHWNGYWDNIRDNRAYYKSTMLRGIVNGNVFVDGTETVFVKVSEKNTKKLEKVWLGRVNNISRESDRIYFKVRIDKQLIGEDIDQYKDKYIESGWYIENTKTTEKYSDNEVSKNLNFLYPSFFDDLLITKDWKNFEILTFYLVRLLGIHAAYNFEIKNQAGKADGFFKFQNLAIIYDCTLENDFDEKKKDQITNYCSQLQRGIIEICDTIEEFHNHQKQVWIITRGKPRLIKKINDVVVKEILIDDLIGIYEYRLQNMVSADDLENQLRNLSQRY